MQFTLVSLNSGEISFLNDGEQKIASGYNKKAISSGWITKTGLQNDQQADRKHHGGEDKAICVYSRHHAINFTECFGLELPLPAFGENFTVDRADEKELYIGDIFSNGEVILEISQPRQPCFKTGAFHGNNKIIKWMSESGNTGFYFRVLKEGKICSGDKFLLINSDRQFLLSLANDIMYRRESDLGKIISFINHPKLSRAWKDELNERLSKTKAN